MKRFLGAIAGAVVLALALPQAADAGVSSVGFFTRNPAAAAPEGGFQVAQAPDGVVSFGAIRAAEAAESVSKATLTLKESGTQNINASGAGLRACVAAGTFKSGKGTLTDGPKADCQAGEETLKRNATGVWTGDVTALLVGDAPAVAVVPSAGAAVFQVAFEPPALDVETTGSSGSAADDSFDATEFGGSSSGDSPSSGEGDATDSSDFGSGSGSSDFGGASAGSFGGTGGASSFGSTSFSSDGGATTGSPPVEPGAAVDTAAPPELAGATATPTRRTLGRNAASTTESGGSGAQFLFFVLAAAVIGTGAGFARNRLVTARGA